jgi:hypothetical protein
LFHCHAFLQQYDEIGTDATSNHHSRAQEGIQVAVDTGCGHHVEVTGWTTLKRSDRV